MDLNAQQVLALEEIFQSQELDRGPFSTIDNAIMASLAQV